MSVLWFASFQLAHSLPGQTLGKERSDDPEYPHRYARVASHESGNVLLYHPPLEPKRKRTGEEMSGPSTSDRLFKSPTLMSGPDNEEHGEHRQNRHRPKCDKCGHNPCHCGTPPRSVPHVRGSSSHEDHNDNKDKVLFWIDPSSKTFDSPYTPFNISCEHCGTSRCTCGPPRMKMVETEKNDKDENDGKMSDERQQESIPMIDQM
ncbi:hypothetical protein FA10DRAFT_260486 [Acaromyces ingoldii]|uniref:Uncharacterized protein n=1 Tax=Acaromyces ingoldii TaxID=215250 RepID=A0A316YPH4_9BASI|nr:hypothetical protein FA10DRAFT_260486 [Acaromyces ingoldii]PWN90704.1 hypothetical protein FA10DRAFT_260486 [Acaromyces ingoldii]